jgi:hypothetical protein
MLLSQRQTQARVGTNQTRHSECQHVGLKQSKSQRTRLKPWGSGKWGWAPTPYLCPTMPANASHNQLRSRSSSFTKKAAHHSLNNQTRGVPPGCAMSRTQAARRRGLAPATSGTAMASNGLAAVWQPQISAVQPRRPARGRPPGDR